jgi:sugar/nucleoside kinase (ribokinase family)
MSLLVVGSIAFDSVKTPFGEGKEVLGGSGTYFSVSASYFTDVSLVGVVGEDFPDKELEVFKKHSIDTRGLEKKKGKTFRWVGEYGYDLNCAKTIDTQLNVFQDFKPSIPKEYQESDYLFLANINPELQLEVLKQVKKPKLVALDTMNFWIEGKLKALKEVLKKIDILLINDAEARELAEENNIFKAAKKILSWGPRNLVIKRGEYGALMCSDYETFSAPAYPLESIYDPTGAGDTFAGGFMGYLSSVKNLTEATLRQAIVFGSVMASFNVEDFSLNRLTNLTHAEIRDRFLEFKKLSHFDDLDHDFPGV